MFVMLVSNIIKVYYNIILHYSMFLLFCESVHSALLFDLKIVLVLSAAVV